MSVWSVSHLENKHIERGRRAIRIGTVSVHVTPTPVATTTTPETNDMRQEIDIVKAEISDIAELHKNHLLCDDIAEFRLIEVFCAMCRHMLHILLQVTARSGYQACRVGWGRNVAKKGSYAACSPRCRNFATCLSFVLLIPSVEFRTRFASSFSSSFSKPNFLLMILVSPHRQSTLHGNPYLPMCFRRWTPSHLLEQTPKIPFQDGPRLQ